MDIPESIPQNVRVVRYFSKEYLYELHTARFVICNARTDGSYFWTKRKGQVYIQTWHSSLRLKTIEKDAEKTLSESYVQSAKGDSEKIDYIISGCTFSSHIFKNSFWYDGKILECGTPRIDYLLKEANKKVIFKKTDFLEDHRYILYSPTFRTDDAYQYNVDFEKLVRVYEEQFGGKWKVLYRLHPNLLLKRTEQTLPGVCIDVCRYSDMQELIAISDFMITDYSSCMFDMMYMKKPCLLYMSDFEEYTGRERDLYFDIKELPFLKAYTEDEMFDAIENFDGNKYAHDLESFLGTIGSFEKGTACQTIAELISKESEKS